jgi:hypothetical protein
VRKLQAYIFDIVVFLPIISLGIEKRVLFAIPEKFHPCCPYSVVQQNCAWVSNILTVETECSNNLQTRGSKCLAVVATSTCLGEILCSALLQILYSGILMQFLFRETK